MIHVGSVSGAAVYWMFVTGIGVLLAGGALLELRRRGRPIRSSHLAGAVVTVLGFATLAYSGVWRSFYTVERTEDGLRLTYRWPCRQVIVPWDSIERINTAPGYKGQRPLRVVTTAGKSYLSAMLPVRRAHRLGQCLTDDLARHRGDTTAQPQAGAPFPECP